MGKRNNKDEEYIRKKIRKLEKKLEEIPKSGQPEKENPEDIAADDSPPVTPSQLRETRQDAQPGPSQISVSAEQDLTLDQEELPEEFLLALGNEGKELKEIGGPIRTELALRWPRLMRNGLGKEVKEEIMKKYPTPDNFSSAVAPVMNPEILATLSDVTVKRDKRIVNRQNITGRMMTCLGKALTSLLKGNINSTILIEEINDAAKLAAEMFYQDSSSRRFLALGGANRLVKEAIQDEKPDELLFGKNCAEKIKAAQAIKKTGSQIKSTDTAVKQQVLRKPYQPPTKKHGNWRGPPQHHHRGRGGYRPSPRRQYNQSHPPSRDQKRQYRPKANYRR